MKLTCLIACLVFSVCANVSAGVIINEIHSDITGSTQQKIEIGSLGNGHFDKWGISRVGSSPTPFAESKTNLSAIGGIGFDFIRVDTFHTYRFGASKIGGIPLLENHDFMLNPLSYGGYLSWIDDIRYSPLYSDDYSYWRSLKIPFNITYSLEASASGTGQASALLAVKMDELVFVQNNQAIADNVSYNSTHPTGGNGVFNIEISLSSILMGEPNIYLHSTARVSGDPQRIPGNAYAYADPIIEINQAWQEKDSWLVNSSPSIMRTSSFGEVPPTDVPEPSTLVMFALGIAGLGLRRYQK